MRVDEWKTRSEGEQFAWRLLRSGYNERGWGLGLDQDYWQCKQGEVGRDKRGFRNEAKRLAWHEPGALSLFLMISHKFSSVAQSCLTLCNPMNRSTPGLPVHHQVPESTQTHVHWVGDAIQPSHPLLSLSPPALNLSQHEGLSNESALCIRWPKYWSFSLSISPSNEHPGLISFRMDWLDFLVVQGTLKSLLQDHSSKASILQSVLSFLYSPTLTSTHDHWKSHSLDWMDLYDLLAVLACALGILWCSDTWMVELGTDVHCPTVELAVCVSFLCKLTLLVSRCPVAPKQSRCSMSSC